jgi:hypothetical protein
LVKDYKQGKISWQNYVEIYRKDILDKLDPEEVFYDLGERRVVKSGSQTAPGDPAGQCPCLGKGENIQMTRIIIELEGGLVTEVYCSDPDADVSVIDRDILEEGDIDSEEEERAWIRKAEEEIKERGLSAVYS